MNIGDLLISQQFAANPANSGTQTYVPTQYDETTAQAIFADLAKRLSDLENSVKLQVSVDTIISQLLLTKDAALLSADKIAIVGQTTFFDWHRNISGQASTGIDPSVTQIIGGVIRTGQIQNLNGASYINLDAVTTGQTFIQCVSAISIFADGQFTFGSSIGKQLKWNNVDLTIDGNALLAGTSVNTVVTGAANGSTALTTKLNKSASDILTGAITVNTAGGISVGTIAWDSSGNLTGGTGFAMTSNGLVAATGGVATVTITSAGVATYAGSLSAATGTFSGDITGAANINITGEGTFNGVTSGGYSSAITANNSGASHMGVIGLSGGSSGDAGLQGVARYAGAYGVLATSNVVGAAASLMAINSFGGTALAVSGAMTIDNTTLVSNLNAQYWHGFGVGTPTTGTGTVTIAANSPGASGNVIWLPLTDPTGTIVGRLMVGPA